MPLYIADLLLENVWMVDAAASERTRLMCWMIAQVNSKKPLKPEDIIKFKWEKKEEKKEAAPKMQKQRWQALQEQAKRIKSKIERHG